MAALENIDACVFDAYGTLFDVAAAAKQCQDDLGDNPVLTVTNMGSEVHLDLTRAAGANPTLTYGWEVSPSGPWLSATDGTGSPLLFYLFPVAP